jgi:hypothetical protein
VVELGRLTHTPTPHIEAVHALVTLLVLQIAPSNEPARPAVDAKPGAMPALAA